MASTRDTSIDEPKSSARHFTVNQATREHLDSMNFRRKSPPAATSVASAAINGNSTMQVPKPSSGVSSRSHTGPTLKGLLGLSTCNSGFLSSLLADVAQAKEDIISAHATSKRSNDDTATGSSSPIKRRRISVLNASPSPSAVSSSSSASVNNGNGSVTAAAVRGGATEQTNKALDAEAILKKPAQFLDLLWEESWLAPPAPHQLLPLAMQRSLVAAIAPPRILPPQAPVVVAVRAKLPATVSETFDPSLHEDSAPAARAGQSDESTSNKEDSFGWFVSMDEDDDDDDGANDEDDTSDGYMRCCYHRRSSLLASCHSFASASTAPADPYFHKESTDCLAFSASTAPKASNHDAQVEWAKAADTVDDVLGDLF